MSKKRDSGREGNLRGSDPLERKKNGGWGNTREGEPGGNQGAPKLKESAQREKKKVYEGKQSQKTIRESWKERDGSSREGGRRKGLNFHSWIGVDIQIKASSERREVMERKSGLGILFSDHIKERG